MTPEELRLAFTGRFGHDPGAIVRAPGRVNLIGEHTDTSDGFVLPMAIDREVRLALRGREDGTVHLRALDLDEEDAFAADAPHAREGWQAYAHGVAWALREAGHALRGMDGVFSGDVPRGAGLSSSAALELALARALMEASGLAWDPRAMAQACRRAENDWVGVASGIMDQLIGACAEEGAALLIDCRTLATDPVPIPPESTVVILDTGTRRGLVGSAYNERRAQVDAAARALGVATLRDANEEDLGAHAHAMDEAVLARARHVVRENARVLRAAEAMRAGDASALGRLMNDSHASLKHDFEVSGPALDAMVDVAQAQDGCFGARMTGAGFAGCAVALVARTAVPDFLADVETGYRRATDRAPALYPVAPAAGAGLLDETA
ncbi:MAG: galactokinase [Trueperaceae bacterium]|nr:galactokinase [Trueperaceae bacterium]